MGIIKNKITRRGIVKKQPEVYTPPLSIFDEELFSASTTLSQLLTVDGTGSGLDADLLDGVHLADIWSGMPTASTTVKGGIILGAGLTHVGGGIVSVTSGIPAPHNLIDTTNHPVTGLTIGHFLKATGATTYGFGAHGLTYSDVNAVGISGTPVDNQIAIWTGTNIIEGLANITYTPGSPGVFHIDGNITASGEISAFSGSAPTNWWDSMPIATTTILGGVKIDGTTISIASGVISVMSGGGMVYPGSGIPLSTGSAWGTSITNNSANWDTAYTDRLKWDGGSTGLVAATGRTSLGLGSGATADISLYATLANPTFTGTVGGITYSMVGAEPSNVNIQNHISDNSQAHSDYLINNGDDSTSGVLTAGGFNTTDFKIVQSGSDLLFKYGTTTILKLSSAGYLSAKDEIKGFSTL